MNVKTKPVIQQKKMQRMVRASVELLEAVEDVLEETGAYSNEFLKSIDRAMMDVRTGKTRRINSLKELG